MINGKKYIGQRKFSKGWKGYLGSGLYLKRAINKYSKESFNREIIAIAYSKEELDELEILFIKLHNASESDDYYNISFGGGTKAGVHPSEETRRKLSEACKGNKYNLGNHHSEESKQKIREGNIGKIVSINTRQKLSESNRKRKGLYKYSEEAKIKLSNSKRKLTQEQAEEIRIKYNTGNFTYKELAIEYKCADNVIRNVIYFEHGY